MNHQENRGAPLSQPELTHSIPALSSVGNRADVQKDRFSVGTVDESMLTPEEKQLVEQYAGEIDIADVDQIVKFGVSAQRNISDFSISILKKVKTYDMGEVGESLKELTIALDATSEPEKRHCRIVSKSQA